MVPVQVHICDFHSVVQDRLEELRKAGAETRNCTCADCPFICSVSLSNPDSLSSSETGVKPGIRSWEKQVSDCTWCQEAFRGIYSQRSEELRLNNLV
jgi:hypothetical protein